MICDALKIRIVRAVTKALFVAVIAAPVCVIGWLLHAGWQSAHTWKPPVPDECPCSERVNAEHRP